MGKKYNLHRGEGKEFLDEKIGGKKYIRSGKISSPLPNKVLRNSPPIN
jgi:hypothetical protein